LWREAKVPSKKEEKMPEHSETYCGATITAKISDATNEFSVNLSQPTPVDFDETLLKVVERTQQIIQALIEERKHK